MSSPASPAQVLVVDDDDDVRAMVAKLLLRAGMGTIEAANGPEGLRKFFSSRPDLVVLDVSMPGMDGFEVLGRIRDLSDVPVLLLTARDSVADRVRGLDDGADDYLGKPFDLDEVAARLRALRRRAVGRATPTIVWQGIEVDPQRQTAMANGEAINLSRREFALLMALIERPGVIQSKAELEALLYGWQEEVESNTVEVHIHHLRAKIGKDRIETVRGLGYRAKS